MKSTNFELAMEVIRESRDSQVQMCNVLQKLLDLHPQFEELWKKLALPATKMDVPYLKSQINTLLKESKIRIDGFNGGSSIHSEPQGSVREQKRPGRRTYGKPNPVERPHSPPGRQPGLDVRSTDIHTEEILINTITGHLLSLHTNNLDL